MAALILLQGWNFDLAQIAIVLSIGIAIGRGLWRVFSAGKKEEQRQTQAEDELKAAREKHSRELKDLNEKYEQKLQYLREDIDELRHAQEFEKDLRARDMKELERLVQRIKSAVEVHVRKPIDSD
jgi:TolA-binding protein